MTSHLCHPNCFTFYKLRCKVRFSYEFHFKMKSDLLLSSQFFSYLKCQLNIFYISGKLINCTFIIAAACEQMNFNLLGKKTTHTCLLLH